ncbi:hypothetical protein [Staphylococcus xylosus]|uniref:hypothetical protein n=1 Tax=Staphylococcus xylosus TaxID=1288 RepID=UPI002DBD4A79|nr:hypothetical protein [Staphylococcus xylosus]MEB8101870.1 hypothetical protein [Staphylococcus xylosus]
MAYEYEESNKQIVFIVDNESSMDKLNERIKELKEVYRKAKAFDKVLELHSQHIDTSSIYESDLPLSANRYEYYDDGLFACEMYTLIKNYFGEE